MAEVAEAKKLGPRACTTCAKAKARCIPCMNPSKCERCDRLDKPCSQRQPAPPRPRKQIKRSKVAQLEEKLNDLTSRLEVLGDDEPKDITTQSPRKRKRDYFTYDYLFPGDKISGVEALVRDVTDRDASPTLESPNTSPWPEAEEADMLLNGYRRRLMPIFPFVMIMSDWTSETFRHERPFAWKAVMLEAMCHDPPRQAHAGQQLLTELSEALLTKPKKSVDLLQGLLLYIVWYNFALNSFQMANLLGLARSLCLSLGFSECQTAKNQSDHSSATLERMRAFAGTYYAITAVFTTSKQPDTFMSPNYLDAICDVLEKNAQYKTDILLVYLVKVQRLAQHISMTFSANGSLKGSQLSFLPTLMVVNSLRSQIEDFKASLPLALQNHASITSQIYIAEALLYEVGLRELQAEAGSLENTERLKLLWSLATTLKSFFTLRFNNAAADLPRFPCISSVDFMYTLITCLKLITLQAPGWDLVLVRETLALDVFVERQIQLLERAVAQRKARQLENRPNLSMRSDPFLRLITMLKGISSIVHNISGSAITSALVTQTATPPTTDDLTFDLDLSPTTTTDTWQAIWSDSMYNTDDWSFENQYLFTMPET